MHTPLEDSIVEGFNRNEGLDDDRANVSRQSIHLC